FFPLTHVYGSQTTYIITATVIYDDGTYDDQSVAVGPPVRGNALSLFQPSLDFSGNTTLNGVFTKPSSTGLTVQWGDGASSTGFFPFTHTYGSPGTRYTITARVVYDDNSFDQVSIQVNPAPTVQAGVLGLFIQSADFSSRQ